jgi:hypothetical protein
MFKSNALTLHSQDLNGMYTNTWKKLVAQHNSFYQDLAQAKDYPPAAGGNRSPDAKIQSLIAKAVEDG